MPDVEVNPEHALAVVSQQRDMFFNAMTKLEIDKLGLAARVAELEAEVAKLNTPAEPEKVAE